MLILLERNLVTLLNRFLIVVRAFIDFFFKIYITYITPFHIISLSSLRMLQRKRIIREFLNIPKNICLDFLHIFLHSFYFHSILLIPDLSQPQHKPFFTFIIIQSQATSSQVYHNQILSLTITGYTENRICKIISSTPKFNDSRDVLIMPK